MATEETKKKIVESAIDLFNKRGFKGITMDDVASSIHISKRTLYEIFASKRELVLECMTQVYQKIDKMRMDIIVKSNEPLLMTLFLIKNAITNRAKYWRLFEEAEIYYPDIHAQLLKTTGKKLRDSLSKVFYEAEQNGDLCGTVDADVAIDVIIMNIRNNRYKGEDNYQLFSDRMREACYTYLRGLLSVKAIERYDRNKEEFRKLLEQK